MKLNPFRKPTAQEIARQELDEARRQLLAYEAAQEHSSAMAEMLRTRVQRLEHATAPAVDWSGN